MMLRTLIWKDCRLVRMALLGAIVSPILLFVISAILIFTTLGPLVAGRSVTETWAVVVIGTISSNLAVAYLLAGYLGGSLLTVERSDQSIEFLTCLPPLRRHVLGSKLLVLVGFLIAQLFVFVMLHSIAGQLTKTPGNSVSTPDSLSGLNIVEMLIGVAGIAWCAASAGKTPTLPLLCGLIAPPVMIPIIQVALDWFGITLPYTETTNLVFFALMMFGIGGIALGSVVYLTKEGA